MKTEKACVTLDDFTGLYQKFGPMVLRRCMYLLKNEEKAYDAMQDVFVRVIERRTELSTVCSSFFYTVATRVCLNRIRSDRLRDCPSLDNLVTEVQDNISVNHEDVADSAALLERIFKEEKASTREMAILHYVEGYTFEETAEKMNMSVSGVRKRLSVLRQKAALFISMIFGL